MGFFKRLFKPKKAELDDEIRAQAVARSLETRRNMAEIKRLNHQARVLEQQQEIMRLKADLDDYTTFDDDNDTGGGGIEDKLLSVLLEKILTGGGVSNTQKTEISQTPFSAKISLSDDEIRAAIDKLPKAYQKIGKKLSDEKLKEIILKQGDFDDDTIIRALKIFRQK